MTSNVVTTAKINVLLQEKSLTDKIEILANLLIQAGFEEIGTAPQERVIDCHNIFRVYLKDYNTHGETLPNAVLLQGLTMLDWLTNKDKA